MIEGKCLVCSYKLKLKEDTKRPRCSNCRTSAWDKGHNIPCEICGRIVMIPHIHHKDDNPRNNSVENRVALCFSCHYHIHAKDKINYFPNSISQDRIRIINLLRNKSSLQVV